VFTARYALSPYIKQIRFVFKGLITMHAMNDIKLANNIEGRGGKSTVHIRKFKSSQKILLGRENWRAFSPIASSQRYV
jgi:hypothetical protein